MTEICIGRGYRFPSEIIAHFSVYISQCNNLFQLGRYLLSTASYRELRSRAFQTWSEVGCLV